jgi:hypothetical protein
MSEVRCMVCGGLIGGVHQLEAFMGSKEANVCSDECAAIYYNEEEE